MTSWNVMADIHSHLEAAASEPPLELPLNQKMWLNRGGSNEAAVTLFIQTVTGCVSLAFSCLMVANRRHRDQNLALG